MKPILYVSLGLNVALASFTSYQLLQKPPVLEAAGQPKPGQAMPALKLAVAPAPPAFQWNQIESEDFPTYVANLRSFGCPEATIHNIVTSEMKTIYDEKRGAVAERNPGRTGQRAAQAEYQKIEQEEMRSVASVMNFGSTVSGGSNTTGAAGQTSGGTSAASVPRVSVQRASYPAVFQSAAALASSPSATSQLSLTPDQKEVVQGLQQQFVQDIGGLNQNPGDPAYMQRWRAAQIASNNALRVQFGGAAFNNFLSASE